MKWTGSKLGLFHCSLGISCIQTFNVQSSISVATEGEHSRTRKSRKIINCMRMAAAADSAICCCGCSRVFFSFLCCLDCSCFSDWLLFRWSDCFCFCWCCCCWNRYFVFGARNSIGLQEEILRTKNKKKILFISTLALALRDYSLFWRRFHSPGYSLSLVIFFIKLN